MPAAPINHDNPLIKILHLGLLDRQGAPREQTLNALGYGLASRDADRLMLTCRAAHTYLAMSQADEVSLLVRRTQDIRLTPIRPASMRAAKNYMATTAAAAGIKPRAIYKAIRELTALGQTVVISRSTADTRRAAIVFLTTLQAQEGAFVQPAAVDAWVDTMRAQSAEIYLQYLNRCSRTMALDAARLGLYVGVGAITAYGAVKWLDCVENGAPWQRRLALASLPACAYATYVGVCFASNAVPQGLGLAQASVHFAREASAAAQMGFYKDAVMLDSAMHFGSPLMYEHHPARRENLQDNRAPKDALAAGFELMDDAVYASLRCL